MYENDFFTDIIYEFTQGQYIVDESMGPLQAAIRLAADSGTPLADFTVFISTDFLSPPVDGTAVCKLQVIGPQE